MMPTVRRKLSFFLVFAMLLSLAGAAFAEQSDLPETDLPETDVPSEEAADPPSAEEGEGQILETGDVPTALIDASAAPEPAYLELYLASYGDDQAPGTFEEPVATLAGAARRAADAPFDTVYLILLTDLDTRETARFYGKTVTLMSDGKTCTVTRTPDFSPSTNTAGGLYNPAMIELGGLDENDASDTVLFLDNVILNDYGLHGGSLYQEQTARNDADTVQDGILALYGARTCAVLGAGSALVNYGGLSAAYLTGGARLVMEDGSGIYDTIALLSPPGTGAVLLHEGDVLETGESVLLSERCGTAEQSPSPEETPVSETVGSPDSETDTPLFTNDDGEAAGNTPVSEEAAPENPFTGLLLVEETVPTMGDGGSLLPGSDAPAISLLFEAPYSVSDTDALIYYVPYTVTLSLDSAAQTLIRTAALAGRIRGGEATLTIHLDPLLTPPAAQLSDFTATGSAFLKITDDGILVQDNGITVRYTLPDGWQDHLDETVTLSFSASLSRVTLTSHLLEKLTSTADATLTVNTADTAPITVPALQRSAETKLLGPAQSYVRYDANGGEGAPADELVSAQPDYDLTTSPAPTHADVDGKKVLFLGWTQLADGHIYRMGETPPETITQVEVPEAAAGSGVPPQPGEVTVYAAYGYDEYPDGGDGTADVLQRFLTLRFDSTGGTGGPDSETKLADRIGKTKFDIPSVEPSKQYAKFQGWAETSGGEAKYRYDTPQMDDDIRIDADTTLYAVWQENPWWTLVYNGNGVELNLQDSQPSEAVYDSSGQLHYVSHMVITSVVPARQGYSFQGWGVSRAGSAKYHAGEEVKIQDGNVQLYAIWQRSSAGTAGRGASGSDTAGSAPATGDTSNPLLYAILVLVSLSALGCAGYFLLRSKKRKKGHKK